MLRTIILMTLLSCASDIAIITTEQKQWDTADQDDGGSTVDDGLDVPDEDYEPASEPSEEYEDEMTELTIGFAEMSLTQIACPACMGVHYLSLIHI